MNSLKKHIKFSIVLVYLSICFTSFANAQKSKTKVARDYVKLGLCKVGTNVCASCVTNSHRSKTILVEVWDKDTYSLYQRVRVEPFSTENVPITLCYKPCGFGDCNRSLYIKKAKYLE